MTLVEAVALVQRADRLFERAAKAWVHGNNSGDSGKLATGERLCQAYREEAERLLEPLGIAVDYPGLYPSFKVGRFDYHDTLSAVSAALQIHAPAESEAG
jgi:hypothetical protein